MGELRGLPGVKGALPCQHVCTIDQALRRIQKRRAVTAAGGRGALNVWRDDQRRLRSEFMRFRISQSCEEHADLDSLRRWLEQWWPELGREKPVGADVSDESVTPAAVPAATPLKSGVEMIAAERLRQVRLEDWTPAHDDTHTRGELARAAAVYALQHTTVSGRAIRWPWAKCWFKPRDPIRNLVRAGALIAAEIDRLQRRKS